jgi:hypothetical protein
VRDDLGAIARIALESRNSHAASYLGLHRILVTHGIVAGPVEVGRIRFSPKVLDSFACSATPDPSVSGIVQPAPHAGIRLLRRLKQMIWGRAMPLWARHLFYAAYLLRCKVKCTQ